jgi:hypothetical protein
MSREGYILVWRTCCKIPKDWSPGYVKELLNRFDIKRPHIQILGVKKLGAFLVERKEAASGRRYKDRQCTYNVILRRVRLTTIAVKKTVLPKYYLFGLCVFLPYLFCMESACIL